MSRNRSISTAAAMSIERTTSANSTVTCLRELPLPYSLALRLRDAAVAPEVICEYVAVELTALEDLYQLAEAKLAAASHREP